MHFPLILMSFCVGILIGLTSMGGAALMAPFLILVVGVRPVTAVGTDLGVWRRDEDHRRVGAPAAGDSWTCLS